MNVWQIRLSTCGRMVMFPSEDLRRRAIRALARVGQESLLSYSLPDDHGHLIALIEGERARALARSVRLAWAPLASGPLEQPWVRSIRSQRHLEDAFEYQLRQNLHHRLDGHPATWSGNCFVDLVGARAVEGLDPRSILKEAMPRYRLGNAYETVGLLREPLRPADDELVRAVGLVRLKEAASAACCAPPDLADRSAPVVRTRVVVARLSVLAGFASRDLAQVLGVSQPTARRLRVAEADDEAVAATRMRISLEESVVRAAIRAQSARTA